MRRNIHLITETIVAPQYACPALEIDPSTFSVSNLIASGFAQRVNDRSAEYKVDSTDFVGNSNRVRALAQHLHNMVDAGRYDPNPESEPAHE